jgi:RES domain-containing protein
MRFAGTVFRAINPRWQHDPLSGEGARLSGGRFNRPGRAALYCALDPVTAVRETNRRGKFQPITIVGFDADIDDLLDLSDIASLPHWGVTADQLGRDDWTALQLSGKPVPTQDLAERIIAAGHAGIVVPSFARGIMPGALNLVLWRWGPDLPHRLTLVDDDRRLSVPAPRAPA